MAASYLAQGGWHSRHVMASHAHNMHWQFAAQNKPSTQQTALMSYSQAWHGTTWNDRLFALLVWSPALQIRVGDRVYVCSTGSGSILELSYPDMTLVGPYTGVNKKPTGLVRG
jgi:hypothetical protein